jgi:hypothetical protein
MYHGHAIYFKVDEHIQYELRPTLDLILAVEAEYGSFVKLAEKVEAQSLTLSEVRGILRILLAVFAVEQAELDAAILRQGVVRAMVPIVSFIHVALMGLDGLAKVVEKNQLGK